MKSRTDKRKYFASYAFAINLLTDFSSDFHNFCDQRESKSLSTHIGVHIDEASLLTRVFIFLYFFLKEIVITFRNRPFFYFLLKNQKQIEMHFKQKIILLFLDRKP